MLITGAIVGNLGKGDGRLMEKVKIVGGEYEGVDDLSFYRELSRVEFQKNRLKSLEGLRQNGELRFLDVSHNALTDLKDIYHCTKLQSLNVSHNDLGSLNPVHRFTDLHTLICSNNKLTSVKGLAQLTKLTTLVISHNPALAALPPMRNNFFLLRKFSAADANLTAFPPIAHCKNLTELRLSHNRISSIPNVLSDLASLKVVDLGHNLLHDWGFLSALAPLTSLKSLNVAQNPIVINNPLSYSSQICSSLPQIHILNSKQLDNSKRKMKIRSNLWKKFNLINQTEKNTLGNDIVYEKTSNCEKDDVRKKIKKLKKKDKKEIDESSKKDKKKEVDESSKKKKKEDVDESSKKKKKEVDESSKKEDVDESIRSIKKFKVDDNFDEKEDVFEDIEKW